MKKSNSSKKETTVPSNRSKQSLLLSLTSAQLNQIYGGAGTPDGGTGGGGDPDGN